MPGMYLLIRVNAGVADAAALLDAIRAEIRAIDSSLPVLRMTTMREFRDANLYLWFTRFGGQLLALLGVLALFLALIGLYGVKAFLMARRTREIGVRMALGATREVLLRQMMRENLASTVAGLIVGLALAVGVGKVLESLLYEVSATDPWVFFGATAFLACAAAFATWLPVERALRVEPSVALRNE
jgi:putative ABC transport system permease protein